MILDGEDIFVEQLSNTNAFDTLYENFNDSHIIDCLEAIGFLCESHLMIQCQTLNVIKIQRINNIVNNRTAISRMIVANDYYRKIFNKFLL